MKGYVLPFSQFEVLAHKRRRTYAETDILFENKVSARKFASTYVDPFAHGNGPSAKTESHTIENVDTQRSDEDLATLKA